MKMESKVKMKFHKSLTFQKLIIISIAVEIMTALTQYMSNSPKLFGKYLSTKINIEIYEKSMQNN